MLRHYFKKNLCSDALCCLCCSVIAQSADLFYENDTTVFHPVLPQDIILIHIKDTTLDGGTYVLKFHVFPCNRQRKTIACDQALVGIHKKTGEIKSIQYRRLKSLSDAI